MALDKHISIETLQRLHDNSQTLSSGLGVIISPKLINHKISIFAKAIKCLSKKFSFVMNIAKMQLSIVVFYFFMLGTICICNSVFNIFNNYKYCLKDYNNTLDEDIVADSIASKIICNIKLCMPIYVGDSVLYNIDKYKLIENDNIHTLSHIPIPQRGYILNFFMMFYTAHFIIIKYILRLIFSILI